MTACCCRLTQPAKRRTTKASGGGSESNDAKRAPRGWRDARRGFGGRTLSKLADSWDDKPPGSRLELLRLSTIRPGPSFRTGRGTSRCKSVVISAGKMEIPAEYLYRTRKTRHVG